MGGQTIDGASDLTVVRFQIDSCGALIWSRLSRCQLDKGTQTALLNLVL